MRLVLLALAGALEVLLGLGVIGPAHSVPWWPLLRVMAAGLLLLGGGLLMADAFALGRARQRPYGFVAGPRLRISFVVSFLMTGTALLLAGSVGLKVALLMAGSGFVMLASGGALWRADVLDATAWGAAHTCITLSGAALFPDFTYRLSELSLWRPAGIVGLTALLSGLLARTLLIEKRRYAAGVVTGMLVLVEFMAFVGAGPVDPVVILGWAAVIIVTLEQTLTALRRRPALAVWVARRLSIVLPAGAGGAVLLGQTGPQKMWGGAVTGAFVIYSLLVILSVGPPARATGLGGRDEGGRR